VALLVLRPENRDARLAAMVVASWAGGGFLFRSAGFGAILQTLPAALRAPLLFIDSLYIAAFFATCLHFALRFPSERVRIRPFWEVVPYLIAAPIFLESWLHALRRLQGDVRPAALPWSDAYSTIGVAMLAASLVVLAVRFLRMADANPRRRIELIFWSLLPGAGAFIGGFIVSKLHLDYRWDAAMRLTQTPATILGSGIFAYAVVRHRIFNVRVLLRRSLQYALAKATLLALMTLPVFGLALFLWAHRSDSIAVLLTGTPAVYVLVILPLLAVIRYRRKLLESLDRRFFREQYDARRLLLQVVSMVRSGSDMLALARAALDEIDRALHPKHLSLWQIDPAGTALHRGLSKGEATLRDAAPLPATSTLASLLGTKDEPLDVHSRATRTLLQRLPPAEREWLQQSGAYLIVPLLIEERLAGLMVLGERKSEEPYSRDDGELLRTVGAHLAMTLDYSRLKQSPSLVWSPSTPPPLSLHGTEAVRLCTRCGKCFEPEVDRCPADDLVLVPEPGVPHVIEDKYVVTRLLGRGGMGSVYLATQKRLNRPVAVKVLLSHLVGSSSMRSRFEREARIVARLRHPAIVTIHDFGVLPSGHAYLVMEYLDGETLRKTIATGPQPLDRALPLLRTVGDAIDAAHRAGVVHRDLKPENIMIVREHNAAHTPRVLDFGLAKMSGPIGADDATLLQSGHTGVVGTLMYMAPEVLSGHAADARADQYSLALIAYELLAGEHPLGSATDLASVVRGHTEMTLIPIRDRAHVPKGVAEAIHRALAKKPEDRFATVGEFVEALAPRA
jgi:predicted Ser/Thr protein kinase